MVLRRKHMPEHLLEPWEIFQHQAERVERARQALLGCLPVGRVEPAPVSVGLELLDDELRAVSDELDAWKVGDVEEAWEECRQAIDDVRAVMPRARRVVNESTELGHVLEVVTDMVERLDAWADAERAWLRLRTRASR